jgi:hypothetical protein
LRKAAVRRIIVTSKERRFTDLRSRIGKEADPSEPKIPFETSLEVNQRPERELAVSKGNWCEPEGFLSGSSGFQRSQGLGNTSDPVAVVGCSSRLGILIGQLKISHL